MPDSSADPGLDDLIDLLRPVVLKLGRHLRREGLKVGLSALDSQILGLVKQAPGIGVSELAQAEQMSRPAMSAHVKRLEADGLLARADEGADGDRRRAPLALTEAGVAAMLAIRRSRNDWLAARLSRLDAGERAALEAAIAPLRRLVEAKS